MRCRSLLSLLGLLPLAALSFVTAGAQVPTPVSVLGHNPGDDFYLADYDDAVWDRVFGVNARGVFQATKAVLSSMKRAGGGSIINISSGTILRGAPMLLHYVSSKGAVFAMTRSMATELAADSIRVNSILAGFTASKSVLNHPTMMDKIRPHTLSARMIKRDMTPDDLCGTAVFLASDASAFITGQAINVDGGAMTY